MKARRRVLDAHDSTPTIRTNLPWGDPQVGRQGWIGVGVVGDEPHVEGTREAEQFCPDVADADRPQGEPHQADSVVNGLLGPARRSAAREAILDEELAGQGEDEGQDGHRDRAPHPVRRDHHRHGVGAARRQIHVVVADAESRHHRQTTVRGQALGSDTRREEDEGVDIGKLRGGDFRFRLQEEQVDVGVVLQRREVELREARAAVGLAKVGAERHSERGHGSLLSLRSRCGWR